MHRNKVAPEVTMINGVPHMLAYVNRAEKDMLRRAGGTGLAGPDGIPAYGFWDDFKSNVSKAAKNFAKDISAAPKNIARDIGNMAKQINNDFGLVSNVAKNLGSSNQSSNNALDNTIQLRSSDAAATGKNTFVQDFINSITPSDGKSYVNGQLLPDMQGPNIDGSAGSYSAFGNTYTSDGNQITDAGQTVISGPSPEETAAAAAAAAAQDAADQAAAAEAKRQAELAAALGDRDAALASQMSSLSDAFGFGTDAYYSGLSDSYAADNNQAFQTAYDDAMRGIYEGFKSAGLLTQSAVDQDKSKLGSANLSETNRLGTAAEEYAKANKSFVDEGRTGIEGQLQGLAVDADTADAYRAQTEAINAFDVAGAAKPFQTPTERSVADFFSDFAKRSYDPSYNVAPTAVASARPSRVTQSVNQFGPNTQASSLVGIRSPFANKQTRVVS